MRKALFGTWRRRAATGAVLLLVTGGVAYAAWTLSATGPGAGKVGSLSALTVTAGTPVGDTFPSTSATGSLAFQVTNPNSALIVTGVDATALPPFTTDPSCPASLFSWAGNGSVSGLSIPLPTGTTNIVIPNVVKLDPSAPTACQNTSFTSAPVALQFSTP